MKTLTEVTNELKAKSEILHNIFVEAGADVDLTKVKSLEGDTKAKADAIANMNKELTDLGIERDSIVELMKARQVAEDGLKTPDAPIKGAPGPAVKFIGTRIIEGLKDGNGKLKKKAEMFLDIDLKADFFTTSGWAPPVIRLPGYVESPTRQLKVADFLPTIPTTQNSIYYMLETTFTNNAAEAVEGASAAESAFALTEESQPVQKIATFVPVSEEQLEDVPAAEAYLNNRLGYSVRQKLDGQILEGSGSPPALKGTAHVGSINTQAKGADPTPDAIYKLFNLIRSTGFAEPSVLFSHPNDWQDIRLLRTADGIYIFGNPQDAGPDRIWGVIVCQTTACTENTMIAGDYTNFAGLYLRRGLQIEMSNGYEDYFLKGKYAVKATIRCAVVHFRALAFGTVTGV